MIKRDSIELLLEGLAERDKELPDGNVGYTKNYRKIYRCIGLNFAEKLLLVELTNHENTAGLINVSIAALADCMDTSKDTVTRTLALLADKGILVVINVKGEKNVIRFLDPVSNPYIVLSNTIAHIRKTTSKYLLGKVKTKLAMRVIREFSHSDEYSEYRIKIGKAKDKSEVKGILEGICRLMKERIEFVLEINNTVKQADTPAIRPTKVTADCGEFDEK